MCAYKIQFVLGSKHTPYRLQKPADLLWARQYSNLIVDSERKTNTFCKRNVGFFECDT